ncbi:L-threonine ammonia-lyase [Callorhinchus milii]|uniref:L-threonine ammonia-lyase n=1 Tax=Callorhinchus milii TaxID=7868 RepID=UPI001C3F8792|nr:L-threonine ammonia-lyase [Callorhinchus milii]
MNLAAQFLISKVRNAKAPEQNSSEDHEYDPFWKSIVERMFGDKRILKEINLLILLKHIKGQVTSDEGASQPVPGPSPGSHCHRDGPIRNGCLVQRRKINPDRMKDFGEDEYLSNDVRMWEVTVTGHSETQLRNAPPPLPVSVPVPARPSVTKINDSACSSTHVRFEDISAAAFKIQCGLQKTPCTYSRLSKQYGMEIHLKKEYLHYTGSTKERGVWYILTSLPQEQQRKGVIVASDNHFSMAVAYHATELHIPVFVIMSTNTPLSKIKMCREYGAMVIAYGGTVKDSQCHAQKLAKENGYLYLQEEDSVCYLAGLGTLGLEIFEQVHKLDAVILPAGGESNLLVGAAASIKHLNPHTTIIGVEPESFPTLQHSLKIGHEPQDTAGTKHTFYGELVNSTFGTNAFQMAKKLVDKIVTVTEEDILLSLLRLTEYEGATVGAEGAITLAAVVAGKLPQLKGKRVVVALCSGNLDYPLMRQCLDRALVLDHRLCKFAVQIPNHARDMVKLLEILAREEVRVLDIIQEQSFITTDIFSVKVTCVVETRDKVQALQLQTSLAEHFSSIIWLER